MKLSDIRWSMLWLDACIALGDGPIGLVQARLQDNWAGAVACAMLDLVQRWWRHWTTAPRQTAFLT